MFYRCWNSQVAPEIDLDEEILVVNCQDFIVLDLLEFLDGLDLDAELPNFQETQLLCQIWIQINDFLLNFTNVVEAILTSHVIYQFINLGEICLKNFQIITFRAQNFKLKDMEISVESFLVPNSNFQQIIEDSLE